MSKVIVLLGQIGSALGMLMSLISVDHLGYDITYFIAASVMIINALIYSLLCGS